VSTGSILDRVAKSRNLSGIHLRILEVLKAHPEGISEGEIRLKLQLNPEEQAQLGRRRRDLYAFYEIEKAQRGTKTVYILRGERAVPLDAAPINPRLRAQVLHAAHQRCSMCGRTTEKHGIALVVDHKVPREWGGKTELTNLWALCEECNHGKKNLFASIDSPGLRSAISFESPHMRIGELLKSSGVGVQVPAYLIEFVADRDDWAKRLRELRYLGWKITSRKKKHPSGRVQSFYVLEKHTAWPEDPSLWIQRYERERAERNRGKKK
jgi:hypothetical protein